MRLVLLPVRRIVLCRPNTFHQPRPSPEYICNEFLQCAAFTAPGWPGRSRPVHTTLTRPTAAVQEPNLSQSYSYEIEQVDTSRIATAPDYGKWDCLLHDENQLAFESNVRNLSRKGKRSRLVDLPEQANDFHLWLLILNYRRERDGLRGVSKVMEGLLKRGSLFSIEGGPAQTFWKEILVCATQDQDLMDNVWAYAEWLFDTHHIQWPGLYSAFITSLVREGRLQDALRWHMRLSPHFGLDSDKFSELFISLLDILGERQDILRMLYLSSPHRHLYDEILPRLYISGRSQLAREWRRYLVCHNDLPRSVVSRPFIRFLAAYHPQDALSPKEKGVAGLLPFDVAAMTVNEPLTPLGCAQEALNSREFVNRVHGQTFGISEKDYNDGLGARYFASTWISLDSAIRSIHILGLTSVGPLTLQSIALREKSANAVKKRIQQLEDAQIGIGDSSYAHAISHWASTDNEQLLSGLVQSDMHPDIFEGVGSEGAALAAAVVTKNWSQIEIIAALRLLAASRLITSASNQLVQSSLRFNNRSTTLKLLDMMSQNTIGLQEPTVDAISSHIPGQVSPDSDPSGFDARFYACLCSMLLHFQLPPSSAALRAVLFQLVNAGCFKEFGRLVTELADYYELSFRDRSRPMMRVHQSDVPIMIDNGETGGRGFQLVPCDLSWKHPSHPFRLAFETTLQSYVIRRALCPNNATNEAKLEALHFADGLRLLSSLRASGNSILQQAIDEGYVRQIVVASLASLGDAAFKELYPASKISRLLSAKARREWMLRTLKEQVDMAWGFELLPSVSALDREICHIQQLGTKGPRTCRESRGAKKWRRDHKTG